MSGTNTLASLRTAAASLADRSNISATTYVSLTDWNDYVNFEIQELYGVLINSFQNYNVNIVNFTITTANTLLGSGYQIDIRQNIAADFRKMTQLLVQSTTGNPPWLDVPRLGSRKYQQQMGLTNYPYTAQRAVAYNLNGSLLELSPIEIAPNTYQLLYQPDMPELVNDTDSIDGYWLSLGGWHEAIVYGTAMRCAMKEENWDTMSVFKQQKAEAQQRCLTEVAERDDNEAYSVQRTRTRGWRGGSNGGFNGGI